MFYIGTFLIVLIFVFGTLVTGLSTGDIFSPSSIVMVLLPALFGGFFSVGKDTFVTAFALLIIEKKDIKHDLSVYQSVFKYMGDIAIGSGVIGSILGAVMMLQNIAGGDAKTIGIGVAVDLLTILYGFMIKYFFCIPAMLRIEGRK